MDAVVPKIGHLIRDVLRGLYSEDLGRELGASVAAFYRTLVDAGIPQQMAESMTEEFMRTQKNLIADAIKTINSGAGEGWTTDDRGHTWHMTRPPARRENDQDEGA